MTLVVLRFPEACQCFACRDLTGGIFFFLAVGESHDLERNVTALGVGAFENSALPALA